MIAELSIDCIPIKVWSLRVVQTANYNVVFSYWIDFMAETEAAISKTIRTRMIIHISCEKLSLSWIFVRLE